MRIVPRRDWRPRPFDPLERYSAGHWPLSEGPGSIHVLDASARHADRIPNALGTLSAVGGSSTRPKWVGDQFRHGFVLHFTQLGDCVLFNSTNSSENMLDFGTESFSVLVWARYTTSFFSGHDPSVLEKVANANDSIFKGWRIGVVSSFATVGSPFFQIGNGGGTAPFVQHGAAMSDDKWHLICGVRDKTANLIKISVDGKAFVTASDGIGTNVDAGPNTGFRLGVHGDNTGLAKWFHGKLNGLRVYKDIALSIDEVRRIYTDRTPPALLSLPLYAIVGTPAAPAGVRQTAVSLGAGF